MEYCPKRTKPRKKRSKWKIALAIILILLALLIWYMHAIVNPVIVQTSEAKVKSITQHTLATSVLNVVQTSNVFDDLIHYNYDTSGKISLISVNSYDANIVARQISSVAQTQLDSVTATGIEVHLGAFTGIALFASSGPLVRLSLNPIGTVVVKFKANLSAQASIKLFTKFSLMCKHRFMWCCQPAIQKLMPQAKCLLQKP